MVSASEIPKFFTEITCLHNSLTGQLCVLALICIRVQEDIFVLYRFQCIIVGVSPMRMEQCQPEKPPVAAVVS